MAPRATRSTMSKKAGILFPAARVHRKLKSLPKQVSRVSKGAAVYMAGVMEYLVGKEKVRIKILIKKWINLKWVLYFF
jgi:hypothetical protein